MRESKKIVAPWPLQGDLDVLSDACWFSSQQAGLLELFLVKVREQARPCDCYRVSGVLRSRDFALSLRSQGKMQGYPCWTWAAASLTQDGPQSFPP